MAGLSAGNAFAQTRSISGTVVDSQNVPVIGASVIVVGNLPRPVYNVQKEGIVVVAITIDQYGKVIEAVPGADGTTVKDQALWSAARKAAMESHFNTSNDPTPTQGTITYNFTLEGSSNTARAQTRQVQQISVVEESVDETAIKFLGIPIDGSKEWMVARLEEKGFTKDIWGHEYLGGQFNGEPVSVTVHTYHNKVDRIIVEFGTVQEMNLREQYKSICQLRLILLSLKMKIAITR